MVGTPRTRVEWVEGPGTGWNVWCFEEDADFQSEDILIYEDLGLALVIDRVAAFTKLKGTFHHYELLVVEHDMPLADLLVAP